MATLGESSHGFSKINAFISCDDQVRDVVQGFHSRLWCFPARDHDGTSMPRREGEQGARRVQV